VSPIPSSSLSSSISSFYRFVAALRRVSVRRAFHSSIIPMIRDLLIVFVTLLRQMIRWSIPCALRSQNHLGVVSCGAIQALLGHAAHQRTMACLARVCQSWYVTAQHCAKGWRSRLDKTLKAAHLSVVHLAASTMHHITATTLKLLAKMKMHKSIRTSSRLAVCTEYCQTFCMLSRF
jgi:hypothetical protein